MRTTLRGERLVSTDRVRGEDGLFGRLLLQVGAGCPPKGAFHAVWVSDGVTPRDI